MCIAVLLSEGGSVSVLVIKPIYRLCSDVVPYRFSLMLGHKIVVASRLSQGVVHYRFNIV